MRCVAALLVLSAVACEREGATPEGRTWYVDGARGADEAEGRSAERAFATIQRGVDAAEAGDTVLVLPGVYAEHVTVRRGGTAERPVRVMADKVEKGRVVLTGAVRAIREGVVKWELVDEGLGLYRVALGYRPTRVLASDYDLLPYPSPGDLRAFRFVEDDYPGCRSGFAWDAGEKALYVRLPANGNPNEALMAVSPPPADGKYGEVITREDGWNLAVKTEGPGHVVIDGLTFETPGMTGVYTAADDVTVRNCWFYGCRYGVAGSDGREGVEPAARVVMEQCYYTQYPAYTEALEVIRENAGKPRMNPAIAKYPIHWQRKGGLLPVSGGVGRAYNYETGLTRAMGDGWVVRRNHVYEAFEALSAGSVSRSRGAEVYENRFERICDNGVESEEHSSGMRVHDNVLVDVFEPFSWQPLSGAPLPGPVYVYYNTVWQTPEVAAVWEPAGGGGGIFKLGARDRNWEGGKMGAAPRTVSEAPGGYWAVGNVVIAPEGRAFTLLNPADRLYAGFFFAGNFFCVKAVSTSKRELDAPGTGFECAGNVVAAAGGAGAAFARQAERLAGPGGRVLESFPRFAELHEVMAKVEETAGEVRPWPAEAPEFLKLRAKPGAEKMDFPVGPQAR